MNVGAAILIVGGAVIWLWGIATPGTGAAPMTACLLGGFMVGWGLGGSMS